MDTPVFHLEVLTSLMRDYRKAYLKGRSRERRDEYQASKRARSANVGVYPVFRGLRLAWTAPTPPGWVMVQHQNWRDGRRRVRRRAD